MARKQNIVRRYMGERQAWIKAGKPVRDEDEVRQILDEHCKPCDHYRSITRNMGQCRLCGCQLNLGRKLNKLRWATTHCPDDPPKWTASVDVPQIVEPIRQPEPAEPETKRERRRRRRERKQETHEETRRERRARERAERRAARDKRRTDKELRLGRVPPVANIQPGTDPLITCDRNKFEIGHALRDLWMHCPAFLVCGGPSVNDLDWEPLKDPAVCSMGVNNVAAHVPVKSMVFSDPVEKFHHSIFLNPGIMVFAPRKKLGHRVRGKEGGQFAFTRLNAGHCPNVFGFNRDSAWDPENFFTNSVASWGMGKACAKRLNRESVLFTPLLGLRLLHYLGVRRVYLLGMDFGMTAGLTGGYAFSQARTPGAASSNNNHYKRVNLMFSELKPVFANAGFSVFNCNSNSRCDAFQYVSYEKALEDCHRLMPSKPYDLSGWYEKDIRRDAMEDGDDDLRNENES